MARLDDRHAGEASPLLIPPMLLKMKHPSIFFILIYCLLGIGCSPEKDETSELQIWEPNSLREPLSFGAPSKIIKADDVDSYLAAGSLESFYNIKQTKITYDDLSAEEGQFLAIQVVLYDKKKDAMNEFYDLWNHFPDVSAQGKLEVYIAMAPQAFEIDYFNSEYWKMYIESRTTFNSNQGFGHFEIRKLIPNLSKQAEGAIHFSSVNMTDASGYPYVRILDNDLFEIRVYAELVERDQ